MTNRRPPVPLESPSGNVPWTPIDGSEQVITGDLSILSEGGSVEVTTEEPAKPDESLKGAEAHKE